MGNEIKVNFCKTFLFTILVLSFSLEAGKLKVFILAGQSNMQGYATVWTWQEPGQGPNGMLDWLLEQPEHKADFEHLVTGTPSDGVNDTTYRDDVWVFYKGNTYHHGNWKVPGWGIVNNKSHSGPESGIGWELGEFYDDQVLLIKTCWGGHSLGEKFLPPSSGGPGPSYTQMFSEVNEVLGDIKSFFPTYDEAVGYEIVGFQWNQGWNDRNEPFVLDYETNMVNFIKDVRLELKTPDLPFVIAETGNSYAMGTTRDRLSLAQEAAADPTKHPEFDGNVVYVPTNQFADWTLAPYGGFYYHWAGSFYSYYKIGEAMGKAMITMLPANVDVSQDALPPKKLVSQNGLEISINTSGTHTFTLLDVSGKILTQINNTGSKTYSLKEIKKAGVYIVKVDSNERTSWFKTIID